MIACDNYVRYRTSYRIIHRTFNLLERKIFQFTHFFEKKSKVCGYRSKSEFNEIFKKVSIPSSITNF